MQRWRQFPIVTRYTLLLALVALICWLALAQLAWFPGGTVIRAAEGGVSVEFFATRWLVINADDCVQLHWNITNASAVYVDDEGRIGEDSDEFCVDSPAETAELRVETADGDDLTYTLDIAVMAYQPLVWFWLLAALTVTLSAVLLPLSAFAWQVLAPLLLRLRLLLVGVLLLLISLGIGLLILELGLRQHLATQGSGAEKRSYLFDDAQLRQDAVEGPMPYLNIAPIPGVNTGYNQLGYRNLDEFAIPKPPNVTRIVAMGDSTTYGLGVRADQTYPHYLQQILREEGGYDDLEVINAGVPSYRTWEQVVNLAFRIPELDPDLIILYTSLNDLRSRYYEPGCYRGYNTHRGIAPDAPIYRLGVGEVPVSTLYRFVGINLGWLEDPARFATLERVLPCGPPYADPSEVIQQNPPVYFERNLRAFVGVAQALDVPLVLATWTHDARAAERLPWWVNAVAEHNDIIRQIAEDTGTPLLDLAQSDLSKDPALWGDDSHFIPAGYERQARLIEGFLLENDLLPEIMPASRD